MSSLRIVFAGTPEFSAINLKALIDGGCNVVAAYSQPDRKAGRGKKLQAPPVKQCAQENNIEVFQPLNFKDPADVEQLKALKPDLMVVVAYGLLLPQDVLDIPVHGCINVHASLLPRWRGAAPIERAIEAGDDLTGVTIMQMDIGLDTGDMLVKREVPITTTTTGDTLRESLAEVGTQALLETIKSIENNELQPEKQDDSLANYAKKLTKQEGAIDWQQDAHTLDRKIRAFNSSNVCYSEFEGERVKIFSSQAYETNTDAKSGSIIDIDKKSLTIACGEGAIRVTEMQLPNAKRMAVANILNGKQGLFAPGKCFG